MSIGELSFESPPFLHFSWKIPDFFRLGRESGYSLQSPDFNFADGRYCLQLFEYVSAYDDIGIRLLNLNNTNLGPVVLCEFQLKSRVGGTDLSSDINYNNGEVIFSRSALEILKNDYVPDGNLTLIFSVRKRTTSSSGSSEFDGAQGQVYPIYRNCCGYLSFQSFPFLYITWRIPGFFQLSRESECTLQSPEFPFADRRYCFRLFLPKCYNQFVLINLLNLTGTAPKRCVSYQLGLKSTSGEEIYIPRRGPNKSEFYILRMDVDDKNSDRFPDGHLTVFCFMRSGQPSSAESPMSGGSESQDFPVLNALVPQAATHPRSVRAETCNKEEDKEALPEFKKLLKDLNSLLVSGENSDVCLMVGGKEFPVHRNILCARSPVFKAMLCHDTERESGTVNIDDCDPDGFQDFLTYVYTGSTRHIDTGNVISLYTTSNKYLMTELKDACVSFMTDNMSVEGFCGIAILALRHGDNELIESATKFFCENVEEITDTEDWVTFLHENLEQAYEHFIKPYTRRR